MSTDDQADADHLKEEGERLRSETAELSDETAEVFDSLANFHDEVGATAGYPLRAEAAERSAHERRVVETERATGAKLPGGEP